MGEDIRRLRPARYIEKDRIIRPYDFRKAQGNDILNVSFFSLKLYVISNSIILYSKSI